MLPAATTDPLPMVTPARINVHEEAIQAIILYDDKRNGAHPVFNHWPARIFKKWFSWHKLLTLEDIMTLFPYSNVIRNSQI